MKILFIIKALATEGGGAEKVLVHVASGLAARGHDVSVITSDALDGGPYYPLSEQVKLIRLGIGHTARRAGLRETLQRMFCYRRVVIREQPDIVVAFMHSAFVPAAVALIGAGVPVVASEHIGPEHYTVRPLQKLMLQIVPLLTARILVVSDQIRDSFGSWLRRRMVVMRNPVVVGELSLGASQKKTENLTLLCVGRLAAQKDHQTLVDAFSMLAFKHPRWTLRIVGEGALREALELQVRARGLESRVQLPGAVSDVDAEYQAAELFVLPSTYESFGLATAEALLHGLPAIGFSDCAGTNELIVDRVNGRLVSGENRSLELSKVLDELMSNAGERQRLANASNATLLERFGIDGVLDRWEKLLSEVVKGAPKLATKPGHFNADLD